MLLALVAVGCDDGGGTATDTVDASDTSTGDVNIDGDAGEDTAVDQDMAEADVGPPPCKWANDGICDEPVDCALGSDGADCDAACTERGDAPELGAACAFRAQEALMPPEVDPALGTAGTGGGTGTIDASLMVPSGSDLGTLVERHFRVYVPSALDPAVPAPLVLVLPGNRVAIYNQAGYTEAPRLAATHRAIVVFLQQEFRRGALAESWWTDWDWANRADENPDFEFIRGVVEWVSERYRVDRTRVFATGHSRGAAMSVIAALEMPDLIAGAVSQSGFVELGYDERLAQRDGPIVPLYFMHGTLDDDVCIDCVPGGECGVTPGRSCFSVLASDGLVDLLRDEGWTDETLQYARLEGVAHRWQPHLDAEWWDFLNNAPRPIVELTRGEGDPAPLTEAERRDAIWTHAIRPPVAHRLAPSQSEDEKLPNAPLVDTDAEVNAGTMVELPEITFGMGHPDETPGRYGDAWFVNQQPEHPVTVSTFRLDTHEVTVAEFARFLTWAAGERHFHPDQPIERVDGGYLPATGADDQPMRQVTWRAAADYCAWVGKRLPTEAEWERAAAGVDERLWPWGDRNERCETAVHFTGSSFCGPGVRPVGSRPDGATPDGVHDLGGNVGEWVHDWYWGYRNEAQTDPTGIPSGTWKVVRGGGFGETASAIRSSARRAAPPAARADDIGFRCAWDSASTGSDDGLRRGDLFDPAEQGREPGPRPHLAAADAPEIVVDGLAGPTALARTNDGRLYVAERAAGRVTAVSADGTTFEVATGLAQPVHLTTHAGSLLVVDREEMNGETTDRILVGDATGVVEVATESAVIRDIVFETSARVVYATSGRIVELTVSDGATTEIASGLDGVTAIATNADTVFASIEGISLESNMAVLAVSRSDGTTTELVGGDVTQGLLVPADVTLSATGDRLWTSLALDRFPRSGLLCELGLDGSDFGCPSWSPPRIDRVHAADSGHVAWTTRRLIVVRGPDAAPDTFEVVSEWSSPGEHVLADGDVWWTDTHGGRLLRTSLGAQ